MKILKRISIIAVSFTLVLMMLPAAVFADDHLKQKVVKIGYYENETFQEGASNDAVKSGYSYEYLQKVSAYNGWKYEYVYGSWTELYDAFVNGDIDLLAGLGYSEKRLDIMNYPDYPMGYESYYLFVRADDPTISTDSSSIEGKKIGTIPGLMETAMQEWLDARELSAEIVLFNDVADRDRALAQGEIDAFIGEGASVSSKDNMISLYKIKNVEMYLCVAKNRVDLLDELNVSLAEMDSKEPYYINDLSQKYFSNNAVSLQVSSEEEEWLKAHNYTIIVGYMDDFLPYCGTDANGNAVGVMVDVINEGFSNLNSSQKINFEYRAFNSTDDMIEAAKKHEIEIMFPVSNDIYYLEQNNLYHSIDVITSAMNFVYRDNLAEAEKGILAINKNNQIQYNYVTNYFKDNEVIYYDTVDECLHAVANGEADGAILSGLRSSILLRSSDYSELSYVELPYSTVKCFGVSTYHKGILPLINQALNSMRENEALTYTYKYIGEHDYSVVEFIKRHIVIVTFLLILLITLVVTAIAVDRVKSRKKQLYYEFAYKDGLTKLLNRRSYEEDLDKLNQAIPDDLFCISMDLTGLKNVNDTFGHAAGDELISEAGRLVSETFGRYGKIYRTGGDEYFGLIRATKEEYEKTKAMLDELCSNWKGIHSDSMKIAVGAATKHDVESSEIMEICKLADKRMYEAKSAWYRSHGVDRRGRDSANAALCNMYTKILKINITDDSYVIVSMEDNEKIVEKGFAEKISEWFMGFGKSGQVHPDDLENYLRLTNIDYLREYFEQDKTSISIHYRRNYEGIYKQVMMEMIPADDYSKDNQSLFLYVKSI